MRLIRNPACLFLHDPISCRCSGPTGCADPMMVPSSPVVLTHERAQSHFAIMRDFSDLTEREILALAIANEEEDSRIYLDIAEGLREEYPGSAHVFSEMAGEEGEHRHRLLELYRSKFGEHIPLIRRHDVRGFIRHKPVWQTQPLNLKAVRQIAESMEEEQGHF